MFRVRTNLSDASKMGRVGVRRRGSEDPRGLVKIDMNALFDEEYIVESVLA